MGWTSFYCLASLLSIGVAYGCTCSGTILEDGNTGHSIGECLTKLRGRYWCYVNPNTLCSDKTPSSRSSAAIKLYYSYDACSYQAALDEPEIAADQITPEAPEYVYEYE